jgi:NitT/TauT family transport system permease protein
MPKVAIAPLFVIWFGFGLMPKVLIVFMLAFFPMLANGIAGFKSVPTDIMEFARSTGAGRVRTFWKVRLPHALPSIFTGLKVGAALAAIGAVVGEFVASDRGLGYLLLEYNGDLNTPMVFAVIVFLSTIGLVVYGLVVAAERFIIPWHVSQRAVATGGPAG